MDTGRFLGFLGLGLLQCCFHWLICFGIVVAMVWCFGLVVLVLCFGDLIDLWWRSLCFWVVFGLVLVVLLVRWRFLDFLFWGCRNVVSVTDCWFVFGVTVADFADCGFVVVGGVGGFSCGFAWF